jgi:hypothetical protein
VSERRRKHRCDGGSAPPDRREASINEMLADPIIRAVMTADGVRVGELKALLRSAAKCLHARSSNPLSRRGS